MKNKQKEKPKTQNKISPDPKDPRNPEYPRNPKGPEEQEETDEEKALSNVIKGMKDQVSFWRRNIH